MAGDIISLRMVPGFAWVGGNRQEWRASEAQAPVACGEGAGPWVWNTHQCSMPPHLSDLLQVGPCLLAVLPLSFSL